MMIFYSPVGYHPCLGELFRDINPKVVLQFLREAGLYKLF